MDLQRIFHHVPYGTFSLKIAAALTDYQAMPGTARLIPYKQKRVNMFTL